MPCRYLLAHFKRCTQTHCKDNQAMKEHSESNNVDEYIATQAEDIQLTLHLRYNCTNY